MFEKVHRLLLTNTIAHTMVFIKLISTMMDNSTAFDNQTSHFTNDSVPVWFAWMRATIFTVVAFFTILINVISIVVLRRMKNIHPVTRLLLISLNITDLCFAVIVIIPIVSFCIAGNWTGSLLFCMVHSGVLGILPIMDLFILLVINGERVIACTRPLRYESIVTIKRVKILLSIVFVFCAFLFFFWLSPLAQLDVSINNVNVGYNHRFAYCVYDYTTTDRDYIYAILFVIAVISPIVIIVLMVIKLLHVAKSQAKRIARELARYGGNVHNQSPTNKGLHTFLLITIGMSIVWVPISVVSLCETAFGIRIHICIILISQTILFSFSWINVTIYYWRNNEFRNIAIQIFK